MTGARRTAGGGGALLTLAHLRDAGAEGPPDRLYELLRRASASPDDRAAIAGIVMPLNSMLEATAMTGLIMRALRNTERVLDNPNVVGFSGSS